MSEGELNGLARSCVGISMPYCSYVVLRIYVISGPSLQGIHIV